jgi:hypothetical protein
MSTPEERASALVRVDGEHVIVAGSCLTCCSEPIQVGEARIAIVRAIAAAEAAARREATEAAAAIVDRRASLIGTTVGQLTALHAAADAIRAGGPGHDPAKRMRALEAVAAAARRGHGNEIAAALRALDAKDGAQ